MVVAGKLIQHLNYITHTDGTGLLTTYYVDPPFVADPSTNPPGSNPNDPTDYRARNRGRFVRSGGSGVAHNRNTYSIGKHELTITAEDIDKVYLNTYTFAGTEYTQVGLQILDTISSVTLTSSGSVAAAPAGDYAIVPSAATGSASGVDSLTDKYTITYANGTMHVGPTNTNFTVGGLGTSSGINDRIVVPGSSVIVNNPGAQAAYANYYWRLREYLFLQHRVSDPTPTSTTYTFVTQHASGQMSGVGAFTGLPSSITGNGVGGTGIPNTGEFSITTLLIVQVSGTGSNWIDSPLF